MAKIVALRGQTPGGWSRERWAWRKRVLASSGLTMTAKMLANELAFGFANHETSECNPGIATLCDALGVHRATVMRALAELVGAGWIVRRGGNAPGRRARYLFTEPEHVAPVRQEHVAPVRQEHVAPVRQEHVANIDGTCRKISVPPTPPYKAEPNMNQKRPSPVRLPDRPAGRVVFVPVESDAAAAWDRWLTGRGHLPLVMIGRRIEVKGAPGWELPSRWPPGDGEETATLIADRFAKWLRARA